jgi:hypothetical protein
MSIATQTTKEQGDCKLLICWRCVSVDDADQFMYSYDAFSQDLRMLELYYHPLLTTRQVLFLLNHSFKWIDLLCMLIAALRVSI